MLALRLAYSYRLLPFVKRSLSRAGGCLICPYRSLVTTCVISLWGDCFTLDLTQELGLNSTLDLTQELGFDSAQN